MHDCSPRVKEYYFESPSDLKTTSIYRSETYWSNSSFMIYNLFLLIFQELLKIDRYRRTKQLLSESGLLSVTNRTADLLKQNKQVNNDIELLRQQTEDFVKSVQRNPANQALLNNLNNPTLNSIANVDTASESDNTEFANILSGIYDFELPSVILAPLMSGDPQDRMPQNQLSLEQTNTMHTPEASGPFDSKTTSAHLLRKRPRNKH